MITEFIFFIYLAKIQKKPSTKQKTLGKVCWECGSLFA